MFKRWLLISTLAIGCAGGSPVVPVPDDIKPGPVVTDNLNVALLSDAIAHQAELAAKDPSVDASELVDGILTKGVEAGIPASYSDALRKACPGVGAKPSRDLRIDEIAAIRGVVK